MYIIDSHCHVDLLDYKNKFKNVIELSNLCKLKNIKYVLSISVSIKNFFFIYKLLKGIKLFKISCGIHPYYVNSIKKKTFFYLEKCVASNKVIAVGETGLDFVNLNCLDKIKQIKSFIYHLYIAKKYSKPIIIHSRNALNETLNVLKKFYFPGFKGVIHCFSYFNKVNLFKFLDLDLFISISGLITFKKNINLLNFVKFIPLYKLLIETDSPYLTPEPYRGIQNDPTKIIFIIKKIAELKKVSLETVINYTTANFLRLFK